MSRRKGERTDKHRHLSHPFQVEIVVPSAGMHGGLMERWAAWHDHETTRAHGTMCFCFCRSEVADAFAMDFGGRRIDRPVHRYSLAVDMPDLRELRRRARAAWIGMEIVTAGRCFGISAPLRGAERMPFSSFGSPEDVACCQAVLERAWAMVEPGLAADQADAEKVRRAYIVAAFFRVAADEDDLVRRAVERFADARPGRDSASEFGNGGDA